jgi:hypothetical protein
MKRKRAQAAARPRCILDGGGVTALIGRSQSARAWLRWIVTYGGDVIVPTPVLAECTTGSGARDAEVNRILAVLDRFGNALVAPEEATARLAGALRFSAKTKDGIDALVAGEAARDPRPTVLLTSDPTDLMRLLARTANVSVRRV